MRLAAALLGALALAVSACASPPEPKATTTARGEKSLWTFDVVPADDGAELRVQATLGPGISALEVRDVAEPFVRDVELRSGLEWRGLGKSPWRAPSCEAAPCTVRYRFALREAAEKLHDPDAAKVYDGTVVSPPSMWLLRSFDPPEGTVARVHLVCGEHCVMGMPRAKGSPDTFEADAADFFDAGYAAFGPMTKEQLAIGSSRLALVTSVGGTSLGAGLAEWVRRGADAVAGYYGELPDDVTVLAFRGPSQGVDGETIGTSVRMVIDQDKREPGDSSWVLPHELVHVCSPNLPRGHEWISEGLATYVEPIARARAGELTAEKVWADFVDGLPQGLPASGDQGLDETHTWGRTYWGGALFFLLADVEIRARTAGRRSLMDALRAATVLGAHAGGVWPVEHFLEVADKATGVSVLREMYAEQAHRAVNVDLGALWAKLGVEKKEGKVVLRDDAPLAALRRSMTEGARGP